MAITYHSGRRIQATPIEYKVHTFLNSTDDFEITSGSGNVEYLVIAGGGSGGNRWHGGGGGAGGFKTGTLSLSTSTGSSGTHTVTVGNGGARPSGDANTNGNVGSPSYFDYGGSNQIEALGGGYGGAYNNNGGNGGSGGGSGSNSGGSGSEGNGTSGQGFDGGWGTASSGGGDGGGGGGAGGIGANATQVSGGGNGGIGKSSDITGTSICYAGGGGGAYAWGISTGWAGTGVATCGGGSAIPSPNNDATNNTGGGGGAGGQGTAPETSGAGGSGIVIVRYKTDSGIIATGGTKTDIEVAETKPTNVQAGSRFEETDTRKMYHYEPQVADYDYPMTTDPRVNTYNVNTSYSTITHANSTLQLNCSSGSGDSGGSITYIDLGSTLSTKWVMRFRTKQSAYTNYLANSHHLVGMSSVAPTTTNAISSTNWVGTRWYYGSQWGTANKIGVEPRISQNSSSGNHNNSTSVDRLYSKPNSITDTTTSYYHEYIWNVDTFTYNLYTNENYTGTPLATATLDSSTNTQWITGTPSSVTGLRYLVYYIANDHQLGTFVSQLDDVEIWDGVIVAATGNAWKEEGT